MGNWRSRCKMSPRPDLSSVFWWLNPVRLNFLYRILYPKRRIESYSMLGTTVSPNKILLIWGLASRVSINPKT